MCMGLQIVSSLLSGVLDGMEILNLEWMAVILEVLDEGVRVRKGKWLELGEIGYDFVQPGGVSRNNGCLEVFHSFQELDISLHCLREPDAGLKGPEFA